MTRKFGTATQFTSMSGGKYLFKFRRITSDPTGYYYDDWSKALPVTVRAASQIEAYKTLWELSGKPPAGKVWRAQLDAIGADQ